MDSVSYLTISREDWNKNAALEVSQWIKQKQNLSYIPWNVATGLLRSYNNELYVDFERDTNGRPYFKSEEGVYILAYVFNRRTGERTPSLFHAVRSNGNKAERDPGIDTIQNQMQRAFAKVIAIETGLGWSLYSKYDESIEDISEPVSKLPVSAAPKTSSPVSKPAARSNSLDF